MNEENLGVKWVIVIRQTCFQKISSFYSLCCCFCFCDSTWVRHSDRRKPCSSLAVSESDQVQWTRHHSSIMASAHHSHKLIKQALIYRSGSPATNIVINWRHCAPHPPARKPSHLSSSSVWVASIALVCSCSQSLAPLFHSPSIVTTPPNKWSLFPSRLPVIGGGASLPFSNNSSSKSEVILSNLMWTIEAKNWDTFLTCSVCYFSGVFWIKSTFSRKV